MSVPDTESVSAAWLSQYKPDASVYDELRDVNGLLHPKWKHALTTLAELGHEKITSRWEQGSREIARNGITYNPHDEESERTRPWQLDALPFVLSQSEWGSISDSLVQWALLGDHVLSDLFGEQNLIKDKVIPPELLFAHPKYHPAFHDAHGADQSRLHLCGSDMARSSDGRWWTSGFRTRAPFGLGYLIENRVMESRLFPEVYQERHVQRIAPFFVLLREKLQSLAIAGIPNPRIVLWSQGPESTSYFEDAYLARYLNYTLALSGDLAVRQGRIMLKTLHGLLPVDVLFRRIDDESCDATELERNSHNGVSGLVEVVRTDQVGILNGLGCDLLEAPIFFAYAQSMCKAVFGDTLKLPPVATWWCGQEKSLDYVLNNLDTLMIRSAFGKSDSDLIVPHLLDTAARKKLIEDIKERPINYVGQECVIPSQTPVWNDGKFEAWNLGLRGFCIGIENSFEALPGGLANVTKPNAQDITEHRVQDTWILSNKPGDSTTLLPLEGERVELQRHGGALPSRVCDNLYWLGRTLERIESLVRIQRISYRISTSDDTPDILNAFLFRIIGISEGEDPNTLEDSQVSSARLIDAHRQKVLFEPTHPGGLQSLVSQAVTLTSTVRDRIALEMWRSIRSIDDGRAALLHSRYQGETIILSHLDQLVAALNSFIGLVHESMTRTDAWLFLDLGRRIERSLQSCEIMGAAFVKPLQNETGGIELLLEIGDSIMTYRSRYLSLVQAEPAIDLLLTDESNPRSIAYQLASIYEHVHAVHRKADLELMGDDERLALAMINTVRLADVYQLAVLDKTGNRARLARHLSKLQIQLSKLSEKISEQYFVHAGTQRHFGITD